MARNTTAAAADIAGSASGTQAISRTLAVLNLFQGYDRDLGISEIADGLSLSASTVHRIVRALAIEGYLAQNEETERYYLGRSAVLLGQAASQRLGLHLAQPILDRVSDETGESVNLGVRDGEEMVVVIRAESKHPLRLSQQPGSRLPVYATAMGKASLSHAARPIDEEVANLTKPLRPLTRKTITSPPKLRRELELIRGRGYSIDDEEAIPGVRCIAVPIRSADGRLLAAVAVQAPAVRMPRTRLKDIAPLMKSVAGEIAEILPSSHQI